MKTFKHYFGMIALLILSAAAISAEAQNGAKPIAAVLGIESKGMDYDSSAVGYMVRLELLKTNTYLVMDPFDVAEIMAANNLDPKTCFGTACIVQAGKVLKGDKVITGNAERFGEKIVISLKIVDIQSGTLEKQDVTEYLNIQAECQKMIGISVQKLLGLTPDKELVSLLVNYDSPIHSPKTKATMSGPRMGACMYFGDAAKVFTAAESKGGFGMYPVMFQFGWQQEVQYLSSGNFAALVEILPMIGGLESGKFVPSLTLMNGFRMGKGGWEFAFGPSLRLVKKAWGYYDPEGNWVYIPHYTTSNPEWSAYVVEKRLDSRGKICLSSSLMLSFGKTFKSGYLNIPVNVYASFRKEGTVAGLSFGFNIDRAHKKKCRSVNVPAAERKVRKPWDNY